MGANRKSIRDRVPSDSTVAEVMVELRRALHAAALLDHLSQRLQADFVEEGAPARYRVQIQGFGVEAVDDEALIDTRVELVKAQSAAQARVDQLLARVVTVRHPREPGRAGTITARVVASGTANAQKAREE